MDIAKAIRKARRKVGPPLHGERGWTISSDCLLTEGAQACSLPFREKRDAERERDRRIVAWAGQMMELPLQTVLTAQEWIDLGKRPADALQSAVDRTPTS